MAEVKWIKIVTDIFDDEKMLLIESLPSADSLIVIWFKLLCLAGKNNNDGVFIMNDRIPYTEEMLSTIFRRDINTVRLALNTFEQFGMIEIVNGVITIPNWGKHQTLDSYEKKKARDKLYQAERRAKQKQLTEKSSDESSDASSDKSSDVAISDIDIEKEIDIEREKDNNNPPTPRLGGWDANKHSNIANFEHLAETEMREIKNKELINSLVEWLAYKDNKKPKSSNHYQLASIRKLANKFFEQAKIHGTKAVVDLVDSCMANNYQGITWDSLDRIAKKTIVNKSADDDWAARKDGKK